MATDLIPIVQTLPPAQAEQRRMHLGAGCSYQLVTSCQSCLWDADLRHVWAASQQAVATSMEVPLAYRLVIAITFLQGQMCHAMPIWSVQEASAQI